MTMKPIALGALLSHAAAVRVGNRRTESTTKMIAGVPVHNYHRAFDETRWGADAMVELKGEKEAGVEHWIAMMRDGVSESTLEAACAAHPECEVHTHQGIPALELKATEAELFNVLSAERDNIEFVEPVLPISAFPDLEAQAEVPWGLRRVRARELSNMPSGNPGRTNGGQGVNVYVMDTGIRTTHSEFGNRAIPGVQVGGFLGFGLDVCNGDRSCALDRQGHGTHCAGTVGGSSYGVARSATLYAVKVLGDNGSGSTFGITNAMDWTVTNHQKPAIASMSLGGGKSSALNNAVDKLVNAGVTVVTAAGNENTDACNKSPGSAGSNINVGATDPNDRRSSFSNYGRCLHIFAPGRDVLSAVHTSDTASRSYSGTSMACPHVSGAAAILLQSSPTLSPADVKARLVKAATEGVVADAKTGSPNLMLYSEA